MGFNSGFKGLMPSSSSLLLLPHLPVPSILPSLLPSITRFRMLFLRIMWQIQLLILHFIVCRIFPVLLDPFAILFFLFQTIGPAYLQLLFITLQITWHWFNKDSEPMKLLHFPPWTLEIRCFTHFLNMNWDIIIIF